MSNPNLLSLLCVSLVLSSLSLFTICIADAPKGEQQEFNYEDGPEGPKNWGSLSTEWKACANGKSQSPIDIETKKAETKPSDLKKAYKQAPAELFNRGHNIAVEWQGDAGGIQVNGSTYKLVQCHWHIPSEHTIDGKRYDAELHVVHSNDKDEKAVIGYFYTAGKPDPFIGNVTGKLIVLGTSGIDLGEISVSSVSWSSKKYYRYFGSLTTPPCKEGVVWTVAETGRSISKDQIKLLEGALRHHDIEENARPLQKLEGRSVYQFDSPEEKDQDTGDSSGASGIRLWPRNGIVTMLILLGLFYNLF